MFVITITAYLDDGSLRMCLVSDARQRTPLHPLFPQPRSCPGPFGRSDGGDNGLVEGSSTRALEKGFNDRPSTTTSALTSPSYQYPALSVQVSHPAHLNRWITPAN